MERLILNKDNIANLPLVSEVSLDTNSFNGEEMFIKANQVIDILIDDLGFMVSMLICHSLFRISNVALHLLSFTHQDIKILGEYNSIFFTHPHAPLLSYVLFLLINPTKQ